MIARWPRSAGFNRGAFGFANGDRLLGVRTCELTPAGETAAAADLREDIETRSLPALTRSFPRHFTFYVADPISSILSRLQAGHTANILE